MSDNHGHAPNQVAAVPAQAAPYEQQPYIPPPGPPVRLMPMGPTSGDKLTAAQMAEFGAMLGSLGAEKNASAAIVEEVQTIAIQITLQHMPQLLAKMKEWERARFQRLLTAVQTMPEAPVVNQGLLNRIMNPVPVTGQPSYVDRNEVMRLIAMAMTENPAI